MEKDILDTIPTNCFKRNFRCELSATRCETAALTFTVQSVILMQKKKDDLSVMDMTKDLKGANDRNNSVLQLCAPGINLTKV